jgi:hypothetical protein
MESEFVTKEKKAELKKAFDGLNDAEVTRRISNLQQELLGLIQDADLLRVRR